MTRQGVRGGYYDVAEDPYEHYVTAKDARLEERIQRLEDHLKGRIATLLECFDAIAVRNCHRNVN